MAQLVALRTFFMAADLLLAVAGGARLAALEGARSLAAHARDLQAPLLALVALHALLELGVPALWPRAYTFLRSRRRRAPGEAAGETAVGGGSAGAAAAAAERAAARADARDGRNKLVASAFAVYVSALSLAALLAGGEAERLRLDPFASSPATARLMRAAAAFFAYDVATLALWDRADAEPVFLAHGALCLWVFACSLRPFLHYMGLVTLLFELSTPFLHAREALLAAGRSGGAAFAVVNWLFASSFIGSRIAFGLFAIFAPGRWWSQMEALVASQGGGGGGGGEAASLVAVVRGYQVCAVLLSALNVMWAVRIVRGGCKSRGVAEGAKAKKVV